MKLGTLGLMPLIAMVACQPQSTAQIPQDKGMEPFAKDKEFHKAHTLREPTGVAPKGKEVVLKVGESKVKCYWNAPKEGQGQVVLMIHEWWGLNDNIREIADALGKETGYGVLAVDLYEGKVAKNADEAAKAMAAVNATKASATVNAAIRAIKNGVDGTKPASKFGTIGYCFGGGWSHKAAIMGGKDVQACVIYYGMPVIAPGELERMSAPVMFVFAKRDKWINQDVVDGFKAAMEAATKPLAIEEYDADHAFANPSSQSFKSDAAKDAWTKTLAFFKKNLG